MIPPKLILEQELLPQESEVSSDGMIERSYRALLLHHRPGKRLKKDAVVAQ